ncbi:PREDICTED: uncharacterized protein LOC106337779 [Brassica oleracea var. oleracea]|uniref:uncharacterized protein LOC106337779 n=1 Tax=Brassica oleracea var. oleracea TaxID=109376 RepID=UPI0006A6C20E|nr:PREDICTED: uncharacterized protein LOC106337779 [Brassica oleracea var. oleracea]
MNLRSRGSSSLVPRVEDIVALERDIAIKRREEEQQAHFQRLGFEMEHNQNQQNNKYHGLAAEDPFDHLNKFDKYCGLSKTNGVSEDAFKLKLFPFSLGDKAHQWEKTLPSDSITTWNECKRAFLEKFFSISRTAKIRNEISSFQQKNLEGFSEAWERFKGYWSQCPHHCFTKESFLSTFYRGALPEFRSRLDTANNGFFLGRTEEDAEELSDSVYSEEYDRSNGGDDQHTRKELKSLQAKLDLLLAEKAKQETMNFVGDQKQEAPPVINEVDGLEGQEELCFINANGTWYKKEPNFQYQNNYQQRPLYNNQQGGYQAKQNYPQGFTNQGNQSPKTQGSSSQAQALDSSVDSMFKKLLEFQTRNEKTMVFEFKNIHTKIDENYSDLNNKFLQLASHFKALESQVASMPSSSKQPMGSLPGKPEKNPKESCNVVFSTTSSEIELSDHEKEEDEIERMVFGTEFGEDERFVVATAEAQIVKDAVRKIEATNLQRAEHKAKKQVEKRADNKLKEVKLEEATEVELSPYDKLPFPQRVLIKARKKVLSKFRKDLSDVGVRLPEISGMREAYVQMMLINDILDHQAEMSELLDISILKIDPSIPPKSFPKLESQGMFTLPCYLGIESMEPKTSSLKFGDSTSTTPIGLIKDFPLKMGACTIPIDITVLKMATEKRVYILDLGSDKVEIDKQKIVMRKKSARDLE